MKVIHGLGLMPDPQTYPFARCVVDGVEYWRAFTKSGRRYWIRRELLG